MGEVAIFVNHAAGEGYISVNPDRYQEGHYSVVETIAFSGEGESEAAQKEARKALKEILTDYVVAVFHDGPAGEAYWEDKPTGNWRGSGHTPFSCVGEYPYSADSPTEQEKAISEAKAHVKSLTTR